MKGNPILGTGSGSIGDVTVMRRNGSQVTRVRLRKIKNPMSQGQAEQRMYMAPILKFYSPLAKVLETSFEGLNKAESYAKFISVNANLARANGWGVKKGSGFVALPYQVAGGSMPQPTIINPAESNATGLQLNVSAENPKWGDVSEALIADYGLQNGDQITFIGYSVDDNNRGTLKYERFFVDSTSTDAIPTSIDYDSENSILCLVIGGRAANMGTVIFSRWDSTTQKWSRSNSFMVCDTTYLANYTGAEKLAAAIASYMKSAGQTPVSDVYLNGSDD